jgi:hypothetical protein
MESLCSSETLVSAYKITLYHYREDHSGVNFYRCKNLMHSSSILPLQGVVPFQWNQLSDHSPLSSDMIQNTWWFTSMTTWTLNVVIGMQYIVLLVWSCTLYFCEAVQFTSVKLYTLLLWSCTVYYCEAVHFTSVKLYALLLWSSTVYFCEAVHFTTVKQYSLLLWSCTLYFHEAVQFTSMKQYSLLLWSSTVYFCEAVHFTTVKLYSLLQWSSTLYFREVVQFTFLLVSRLITVFLPIMHPCFSRNMKDQISYAYKRSGRIIIVEYFNPCVLHSW